MSADPASGDRARQTVTVPGGQPVVPGYEILEEIGRGGMGVVYKARHTASAQIVALKMIRDGALAGREQRDRFRIEAEAVARMQHPNIVRIQEVGEHAGRQYFVMEFVDGVGLDKHLADGLRGAVPAANLVRTLALAVQHAHEQMIVHRDLKPANVLLQTETLSADCKPQNGGQGSSTHGFGVPKITDFGLAKRLDADSTAWTVEGVALGTPAYMAPEQAAGRINEIGSAVDVYALGVILYELVTGRPPFQGDSRDGVIQQVLHKEPELPTRLRSEVPRDLETVCLKCLEKAAADRYASAGDLAADLDRFLENKPITAVPRGPLERLTRCAARDGYQSLREVGRGPQSILYHARYGRLQQPVAMKVFTVDACTREEWEATLRLDAARWSSLTHPQVVPVQRAGWWEGCPYLVRDYAPQGSLADKIGGQPWPVPAALGLVEQLAGLVAYLHRQGVVHANLKPANVLLAADGIPRLTDFRLSGGLLQTPLRGNECAASAVGYLPPELLDAQAEPRPHADVYGLGVILYELLTGRAPFAGADAVDVMQRVRTEDPVPPSYFNRDVKAAVDQTCLRCLQKNRWARYTRAHDVASRLRYLAENL
jgi:eukaryotic-like serine/threonine-protein kinase